jgi:hypothetical protein
MASGITEIIDKGLKKILQRSVRLISTEAGYVRWAHPEAKEGDTIWPLSGCPIPLVLRSCQDGYTIVGSLYLYGLLGGKPTEVLFEGLYVIKVY